MDKRELTEETLFRAALDAFGIKGEIEGGAPFGSGHINRTFKIALRDPSGQTCEYILQEVNTYVFRKPYELMENIAFVTETLKTRGIKTLSFLKKPGTESYLFENNGRTYRLSEALPGISYDLVTKESVTKSIGRAFGDFEAALLALDPYLLHETIPGFHDTEARFQALFDAEKACGNERKEKAREELRYLRENAEKACFLARETKAGRLTVRVVHNDTKCNNVLVDPVSDEPVAVIDLDTVMAGTIASDYGDAIRCLGNTAEEDEPDLSKVSLDLSKVRWFTEGYLGPLKTVLTDAEKRSLPYAPYSVTMEIASRFLGDYLAGDPYFRTAYPDHNLIRTRCAIAFAKELKKNEKQLIEMTEALLG